MPVFAAMILRPFTVLVASSSPAVVRMPSDFSLEAAKAVKPSISEIGYVMILNSKRCFRRTVRLRELADAQTKSHQPGAKRHQATAHQPAETTAIARGRDRSFRARNHVDQSLNL